MGARATVLPKNLAGVMAMVFRDSMADTAMDAVTALVMGAGRDMPVAEAFLEYQDAGMDNDKLLDEGTDGWGLSCGFGEGWDGKYSGGCGEEGEGEGDADAWGYSNGNGSGGGSSVNGEGRASFPEVGYG